MSDFAIHLTAGIIGEADRVYPARRKLWRASSCLWPSQIFVPSSAEL
jgi:hypothetical protein